MLRYSQNQAAQRYSLGNARFFFGVVPLIILLVISPEKNVDINFGDNAITPDTYNAAPTNQIESDTGLFKPEYTNDNSKTKKPLKEILLTVLLIIFILAFLLCSTVGKYSKKHKTNHLPYKNSKNILTPL